jgi:hypothetical protein
LTVVVFCGPSPAPVGAFKANVAVSGPSFGLTPSWAIGITTVLVTTPGAKVSVVGEGAKL